MKIVSPLAESDFGNGGHSAQSGEMLGYFICAPFLLETRFQNGNLLNFQNSIKA